MSAAATSEADKIVAAVNALSDDAIYLASRDWFGAMIMNKSVLAVASNDRQRAAFDELTSVGFAYLDTERGQVGFRSTALGQMASPVCRSAIAKAEGRP